MKPTKKAAALRALKSALSMIAYDLKHCDWSCQSCGHDPGMDEVDLHLWLKEARKAVRKLEGSRIKGTKK